MGMCKNMECGSLLALIKSRILNHGIRCNQKLSLAQIKCIFILIFLLETCDKYCGVLCQFTAVGVQKCQISRMWLLCDQMYQILPSCWWKIRSSELAAVFGWFFSHRLDSEAQIELEFIIFEVELWGEGRFFLNLFFHLFNTPLCEDNKKWQVKNNNRRTSVSQVFNQGCTE